MDRRMNYKSPRWLLIFLAASLLALAAASCGDNGGNEQGAAPSPTSAEQQAPELGSASLGQLEISDAFVRAAPAGDVSALYFTVTNDGDADDALVGAHVDIAGAAQLHETVTENNQSMMRPVERIDVPAGGEAVLEPGGYHVMLMDLKEELREGERTKVVLEFEKAGSVTLEVPVLPFSSEAGAGDDMHMDTDMGGAEGN
jgi:copper(I)-binding protein